MHLQQQGGGVAGVTNGNPFPSFPPAFPAYVHSSTKTHTGVSSMGSTEWQLEDEEVEKWRL